jgi:O-antigen/teichoic acid export membrane protein
MSLDIRAYQKNFFTMLTGNTLSQLIPFIFAPLLGRLFSPEQFGIFNNFLAITSMIGIISAGRLEMALPLPALKLDAKKILLTGLGITILLTVLSILIPLFSKQIALFYNDPYLVNYLWFVPIGVLSYGLFQLSNNWTLRNKNYRSLSTSKIAQSFINNGIAAILGYIGWGVQGMIFAWLCSQFLAVFILSYPYNKKGIYQTPFTVSDAKVVVKKYRDFLTINSLHAFMDLFVNQFLVFWIITLYFGKVELGLFSVMVKYLKAPVVLISSSVSQMFFVEASQSIQNNTSVKEIYFRTLKTTAIFSVPFGLVVYFFGPVIFKLYMGDLWINAGVYAQIYLPVLIMMFFVSPVSSIPILFGKQKQAFLITIIGYGVSLSGLVIGVKLGWEFKSALLLHSGLYMLLQLFFVVWYYKLINTKHARTY